MTFTPRVLPSEPLDSLEAYQGVGGGSGLEAARAVEPATVIAEVEASGLRGRGGAGFPTGLKWRTVAENASEVLATTVVVNAAEGEPGTYKDRAILQANPWAVVEGALIAAHAVGARQVIVATKARFTAEVGRLRAAIAEMADAGWLGDVTVDVFEGPEEYLYGEETALLEVLDGRLPFPRIAPPYRRGYVEVVADDEAAEDAAEGSASPAEVEMAGPGSATQAPPALVNNVETMANVPAIVARGAGWFREIGTDDSPGTIVVTVSGSTQTHAVGEVPMGTTLRDAIDRIGGGPRQGSTITGVLVGSAAGVVPGDALDVPLTYEDFERIGSSLGSAGFVVRDEGDDMVAVAAGVSRFLAVESCGQCTPCKGDGLAIAALLERVAASEAGEHDMKELVDRVATVSDEARCFLAHQHQAVVGSILERFPDQFAAHVAGQAPATAPVLFAEYERVADGAATLDGRFADKQPDWTHGEEWSGKWPAEAHADQRVADPIPE